MMNINNDINNIEELINYFNLHPEEKEFYPQTINELKVWYIIHNLPDDKYKIFLTHSPEPIQDFKNQELLKDYNLIIAAHYHNGVVPEFLDFLVPKNKGLLTPRRSILPSEARGIVKLLTGTYLMYNGGWTKIPATAKPIEYPLDKFFNRDIDLTTITNNYEYYDMLVKTKKIKL